MWSLNGVVEQSCGYQGGVVDWEFRIKRCKYIYIYIHDIYRYIYHIYISVQFSHSVASDSATPWNAARQASLSIINSQSLLKLLSIESVMPSNHLIICRPLLFLPSIFPSIWVFQMSQIFSSDGQSIGVSASASVLPMNTQD